MLLNCVFVALGGGLGAMLRYLCSALLPASQSGFPVVTLGINALGSLALAFFGAWLAGRYGAGEHLMLFLRVGLCGGFTTFSTFSVEAMGLFQGGKPGLALLYMLLSFALCLACAFGGDALGAAAAR